MVLTNYEPRKVFQFFEEICNIPHGSGNEKAISDYLVEFAECRNLWVCQDKEHNVLIKKSGTAGYENAPSVILQGHIDMVCEKNNDTDHDFYKDPLKLYVDGDYLKAKGTTLGADNGIAVALAMALLDSNDIPHPPIEFVATTNEEVGMEGAHAFDGSLLDGKIFINLDSEEEGIFYSSCAGGMRAIVHLPVKYADWPKGYSAYSLNIKGLKGGHSGIDIDKQRANANVLMGRTLQKLFKEFDIYIGSINGGSKDNAIPREAESLLAINQSDFYIIQEQILKLESIFRNEHRMSETDIILKIEKVDSEQRVYTKESTKNIIAALNLIPNGVQNMSLDIEGLVETSNNLGVVRKHEHEIEFVSAVRSSVMSRKKYIQERIEQVSDLIGAITEIKNDYPSWEYNPSSNIRKLCMDTFKEIYGRDAELAAIHAGLECGLFAEKIENPDMVSLGPDIKDVHTPDEHLSISSTLRTWEFLQAILAKIL